MSSHRTVSEASIISEVVSAALESVKSTLEEGPLLDLDVSDDPQVTATALQVCASVMN